MDQRRRPRLVVLLIQARVPSPAHAAPAAEFKEGFHIGVRHRLPSLCASHKASGGNDGSGTEEPTGRP